VLYEEHEEDELDVDGSVLDDHIDDEIIKNDIDDDVAMHNPFNVNFESDSELDDTKLELDEEAYQ
jgi:hypothetical protein